MFLDSIPLPSLYYLLNTVGEVFIAFFGITTVQEIVIYNVDLLAHEYVRARHADQYLEIRRKITPHLLPL